MSTREDHTDNKQGTALAILARIWWMLLGNIFLIFPVLFILDNRGGFFHAADVVFWAAWGSLLLVRYVDIKFLGGCTATGERASMTHWTRYAIALTVGSLVVWALAHAANRFFAAAG
jgi:hypothetical protein